MIVIIYENIKALCAEKGVSIAAIEKESGVGNGVVGKWRESAPTLSTLEKIAKALDVPVARLLEK